MWVTISFYAIAIFVYLTNKIGGKPTDISSKGLEARGKFLFYFTLIIAIIRTIGHIFGFIK